MSNQTRSLTGAAQDRARLLSVAELSDYLGIPPKTLYNWRHLGRGPRGFKIEGHLRYRMEDVLAFEEDQLAKEDH